MLRYQVKQYNSKRSRFSSLNQKALHGHMHYTCRSLGLSKGCVGYYMLLYTFPSTNSNRVTVRTWICLTIRETMMEVIHQEAVP